MFDVIDYDVGWRVLDYEPVYEKLTEVLDDENKMFSGIVSKYRLSPDSVGIMIPHNEHDFQVQLQAMESVLHEGSKVNLANVDLEEKPWMVCIKNDQDEIVFATRLVHPTKESPRLREPGILENGEEVEGLLEDYVNKKGFKGEIMMFAGVARIDDEYRGGYEPTILYRLAMALQEAMNNNQDLLIASTVRIVNKKAGLASKILLKHTLDKLSIPHENYGHMTQREVPTDLVVAVVAKENLPDMMEKTIHMIKSLETNANKPVA